LLLIPWKPPPPIFLLMCTLSRRSSLYSIPETPQLCGWNDKNNEQ
jgi:hypothetical protein